VKRVLGWLRHQAAIWLPVIVAVLLIRSFVVESFVVPTGSMEDTIEAGDAMLVNKFVFGIRVPFTEHNIVPVSTPRRGDIVVFRYPQDPEVPPGCSRIFPSWLPLLPVFWDNQAGFLRFYTPTNLIKRCVALAGDTVEYREKELYINGVRQDEPKVRHKDYRMLPGFWAPPDSWQALWEGDQFYRTGYSPYVRDNFGPVVVPEGCVFAMGDNRDNSEDCRFWGPLPVRNIRGRPLVLYFSSKAAVQPVNIIRVLLSPWAIRLNRIGRLVR
jgi:signal peptidase I